MKPTQELPGFIVMSKHTLRRQAGRMTFEHATGHLLAAGDERLHQTRLGNSSSSWCLWFSLVAHSHLLEVGLQAMQLLMQSAIRPARPSQCHSGSPSGMQPTTQSLAIQGFMQSMTQGINSRGTDGQSNLQISKLSVNHTFSTKVRMKDKDGKSSCCIAVALKWHPATSALHHICDFCADQSGCPEIHAQVIRDVLQWMLTALWAVKAVYTGSSIAASYTPLGHLAWFELQFVQCSGFLSEEPRLT